MYTSQITRSRKGAILLLLDLSGSMAETIIFEGREESKAQALANVVNSLVEEIISRCQKEHFVGDYFDIAIVGYSGTEAVSMLGRSWKSIAEVDQMYRSTRRRFITRILPDGRKLSTIVESREWIAPQSNGRTPMGKALKMAKRLTSWWCSKHPESFPPIVINISDGEATDASHDKIRQLAKSLCEVGTSDGNVLLMNIHIATGHDSAERVMCFPSESAAVPASRYARLLYDISSTLPEVYNREVGEFAGGQPPYRAICYNAPIDEVVSLLAIGSLTTDRII